MQDSNKYNYVIPKEGSNLWFDNMVIPKTAQNKEGAYKFMNFLLDAKIINKIQNGSDMLHQIKRLVSYYLKKLEMIIVLSYPKEQSRLEVYKDLGPKTLGEYNESFLNFKMSLK